jgi:hypothetical protein
MKEAFWMLGYRVDGTERTKDGVEGVNLDCT